MPYFRHRVDVDNDNYQHDEKTTSDQCLLHLIPQTSRTISSCVSVALSSARSLEMTAVTKATSRMSPALQRPGPRRHPRQERQHWCTLPP
jgi:hypothetical protein